MDKAAVGILGASGLVGANALNLLAAAGEKVVAFSRTPPSNHGSQVDWRRLPGTDIPPGEQIPKWLCACPIWAVPAFLPLLKASGAQRLVVLSSTSVVTKMTSSESSERSLAERLAHSEVQIESWCRRNQIEWVILRPTLIYGGGRDKSVAEIARFIRRFGFFPLLSSAEGLRQPVHAADVAAAAIAALNLVPPVGRIYNLSGAEILPYRELVRRVFVTQGRRQRMLVVPARLFGWAIALMRLWPRYRKWSVAMVYRMNCDLVFDHSEARRDLGFSPQNFILGAEDVS